MSTNLPSQLIEILDFIDDYDSGNLDEDIDLGAVITGYRYDLNQLRFQYEDNAKISKKIDFAEQSLDRILDVEGIPTVEDSGLTVEDIARYDDL